MSDKTRTFPLPLSSITDKSPAQRPVYNTVATPQTATQNAARTAAASPGGWRPPQPVASPSRAHS